MGEELEVLAVDGLTMDVAGFKDFPELAQHVGTFVFELFEFWGEEDHFVGEAFEERGFAVDDGIDDKTVAVAIGGGGEEVDVLFKVGGGDVFADPLPDEWIHAVVANGLDEFPERGFFGEIDVMGLCPVLDFLDGKKACTNAVGEVVEGVCGVIGPIHDLAFDGFEGVPCFARCEFGGKIVAAEAPVEVAVLEVVDEMVFGRVVIGDEFRPQGFVFQYPVEEGSGGRHSCVFGGKNAFGEQAKGLCVSLETAVISVQVVEGPFSGVAEGWVAEIVG